MENNHGSANQEWEHWTESTVTQTEMEVEGSREGTVKSLPPPGSLEPLSPPWRQQVSIATMVAVLAML